MVELVIGPNQHGGGLVVLALPVVLVMDLVAMLTSSLGSTRSMDLIDGGTPGLYDGSLVVVAVVLRRNLLLGGGDGGAGGGGGGGPGGIPGGGGRWCRTIG